MLLHASGHVVVMKTLEDEQYIVIKAYKFTVCERFLYYHMLHVRAIPTYRIHRLYNITSTYTSVVPLGSVCDIPDQCRDANIGQKDILLSKLTVIINNDNCC